MRKVSEKGKHRGQLGLAAGWECLEGRDVRAEACRGQVGSQILKGLECHAKFRLSLCRVPKAVSVCSGE